MTNSLYGIYGVGGCGRGILPLARDQLRAAGQSPEKLVFIDDAFQASERVNGHRVMSYAQFVQQDSMEKHVALAVASGATRARLSQKLQSDAINTWSVRASNVVTMDNVEIAEGALLSPFVTLTSNIRVGRHFHANLYSYVEHDCVIGDFVTLAPAAKCNGNIHIEDFAYIGTGAILRQGQPGKPIVIGRGAVVGMGAVVTRDVPPGATVVGNPAKPLVKD